MWPRDRFGDWILTRAILPTAAVGGLLLLVASYGAWHVYQLQKRSTEILSENVSSVRAAEELETIMREVQYRIKQHLTTENPRHLSAIADLRDPSQHWLAEMEQLATSTREVELVERVERGHEILLTGLDAYRTGEDDPERLRTLANEVLPNKILASTQRYIVYNERQVALGNERNMVSANRLIFGMIFVGATGGLAGLGLGYAIAYRLRRTIVQLSFPLRSVAGRLNNVVEPVSISADPGFEDLEEVLRRVSTQVETVVERLQKSELETLRSEQLAAVGQLAAGFAHEIRNPLTSMKVIVESVASPHELDYQDLQILRDETIRLEQSTQMFLDFARPPLPEKRSQDLRRLVEHPVGLAEVQAERIQVQIEVRQPDTLILVEVDGTQIGQVVLNLLMNALDASPTGSTITLELDETSTSASSRGGTLHWAVIRVRDQGMGLPNNLRQRIFDPFVSNKPTGIGLGLSICKRIVEAHGGKITAEDTEAAGATFTVVLPRVPRSIVRDEVGHAAANRQLPSVEKGEAGTDEAETVNRR
ncbi:MAG: ATP-binding protein [Pirellulaceae bacterium]